MLAIEIHKTNGGLVKIGVAIDFLNKSGGNENFKDLRVSIMRFKTKFIRIVFYKNC